MSQSNVYMSDSEMMDFEDLEDALARSEAATLQARVIEQQGRDICRAVMALDNGVPSAGTLRVQKQLLEKLLSLLSSGALADPLREPVGAEHMKLIEFYNSVVRSQDARGITESSQPMLAEDGTDSGSVISVSDDDDEEDENVMVEDSTSNSVISISDDDEDDDEDDDDDDDTDEDKDEDDDQNGNTETEMSAGDSVIVSSCPFMCAPSGERFDYGDEFENRREDAREAWLSRETDSESEDEERFKNLNIYYI